MREDNKAGRRMRGEGKQEGEWGIMREERKVRGRKKKGKGRDGKEKSRKDKEKDEKEREERGEWEDPFSTTHPFYIYMFTQGS